MPSSPLQDWNCNPEHPSTIFLCILLIPTLLPLFNSHNVQLQQTEKRKRLAGVKTSENFLVSSQRKRTSQLSNWSWKYMEKSYYKFSAAWLAMGLQREEAEGSLVWHISLNWRKLSDTRHSSKEAHKQREGWAACCTTGITDQLKELIEENGRKQ